MDDDGLLRVAVAGHLDDEALGVAQRGEDLVRDPPVVGRRHVLAIGLAGPLHGQVVHVAAAGDVHHVHQEPVVVAVQAEPNAAGTLARNPAAAAPIFLYIFLQHMQEYIYI
jgi:hypothetical protein